MKVCLKGSNPKNMDYSKYVLSELSTFDVRFPTSDFQHGSDAIHLNPDYSAPYVVLHFKNTNNSNDVLKGKHAHM